MEIELLVVSIIQCSMPSARRHPTMRHQDRRSNDPNYEKRVEEALASITAGEYRSFRDAARITGVRARRVTSKSFYSP